MSCLSNWSPTYGIILIYSHVSFQILTTDPSLTQLATSKYSNSQLKHGGIVNDSEHVDNHPEFPPLLLKTHARIHIPTQKLVAQSTSTLSKVHKTTYMLSPKFSTAEAILLNQPPRIYHYNLEEFITTTWSLTNGHPPWRYSSFLEHVHLALPRSTLLLGHQ